MPLKPWPFVTDGIVGLPPTNWYPVADSDKQVILLASPGLSSICTLTDCTEVRGLYAWNGYLYAVARRGGESVLWRVNTDGEFAELGTITSSETGPVWIVNNPTQMCIADGVSGWVYTPGSGAFQEITDAAFMGGGSVTYQDGYGIFHAPNTNEWFWSNQYDFTTFDATNFASKEATTDNIRALMSTNIELWIAGEEKSTEVWSDVGGPGTSAASATWQRNQGGVFEYGCGAAKSLQIFDNTPIWLTQQGQLIRVLGYSAKVVSNDSFGRAVQAMDDFSDAQAFVYTDKEHVFYQINFPSGGQTWVLDAKTNLLHLKSSYLDDNSGYGRHRANCYAWLDNKHYVGDYSNGKIYEMSTDYYSDDGEEIPAVVYSKEVIGLLKPIYFPEIQVLFEMGVGNLVDPGSDPYALLEKSEDGAKTWVSRGQASMGMLGEYTKRAIWHLNGQSFRRQYRLTVTDPVLKRLLGIDWGMPA